jgi:hypothetical protein
MSTLFVDAAKLEQITAFLQPAPSITQWQRLEAEPAELDLAAGLEAALADPLWLIGRQWQFAELKGENAGMPVRVTLKGEEGRLAFEGQAEGPDALPAVAIEAEPARAAVASIALEAALDFKQALRDADAGAAFAKFQAAYPLELKTSVGDRAGEDLALLFGSSSLDAIALAQALEDEAGPDGLPSALPATVAVPATFKTKALKATSAWLEDWRALLVDPKGPLSWKPERLEYTARLTAATEAGTVPLDVTDYASGRFDWWAMDVAGPAASPVPETREVDAIRIPVPIKFPGMAADRLFEIEPDAVSVLNATAGPTGLLAMLLIEYVLSSSNDWYQVPLTLNYGTAFRVGTFKLVDTFGIEVDLPPSATTSSHWSMFATTGNRFADAQHPLFLLPAATAQVIEGEPIEEVAFFRDELANLAWAVERQLPGVTPTAVRPPPDLALGQALDDSGAQDAALLYRLATPMPKNWYPLAPEQDGGAMLLRLRPLRRFEGGSAHREDPTAALLQGTGGKDLAVEEQEIPRSGLIVTRSFQVTRDAAGRRLVWLGRRKKAGRGEGRSGLKFDLLEPAKL